MEKRALLAVVLSLLVLFAWSTLFPPARTVPKQPELSQNIENKEVTSKIKVSKTSLPEKTAPSLVSTTVEEVLHQVEADLLTVKFSNIGGSIKEITINEHDTTLPLTNFLNIAGYEKSGFTLEQSSDNRVTYSLVDGPIKISKTYQLYEEDYLLKASISIENQSEMSKLVNLDLNSTTVDLSSLDNSMASQRNKMLLEYSVASKGGIFRKHNAAKFSQKEAKEADAAINWIGFRDRYFCLLMMPEYETKGYEIDPIDETKLNIKIIQEDASLNPGTSVSYSYVIYTGPQDLKLLKSYDLGFEKMMDFRTGGFLDVMSFGQTDTIAKLLLSTLHFLYKIFPNWGVCIILLALIVYGCTYPLTHKSLKSMRKMQLVQPEMAKLQQKHKDNPQKLNKEVMELYKKHRVNPLGGCLPMFVQYPVFIGLYQLLWRYYGFKGASFLWIKDLSEPDRLFTLSSKLPFIGNEINLLPVIFVVLILLQQKVSTKNVQSADPTQQATQKMMMRILPIMILVFFYKIASGIALYFLMVSFFSILTQLKIAKQTKALV